MRLKTIKNVRIWFVVFFICSFYVIVNFLPEFDLVSNEPIDVINKQQINSKTTFKLPVSALIKSESADNSKIQRGYKDNGQKQRISTTLNVEKDGVERGNDIEQLHEGIKQEQQHTSVPQQQQQQDHQQQQEQQKQQHDKQQQEQQGKQQQQQQQLQEQQQQIFNNSQTSPNYLLNENVPNIKILSDICIEPHGHLNVSLTAYNSKQTGHETIRIRTDPGYQGEWVIRHSKSKVPYAFQNNPVFLSGMKCEGNLFHFFKDTLYGLYGILNATKRLNATEKNHVFLPHVDNQDPSDSCHSSRYKDFILPLGVHDSYGPYTDLAKPLCFRHAVFGTIQPDLKDVYRFLTDHYKLDSWSCTNSPKVILLQRSVRTIMNMNELLNITRSLIRNATAEIITFDSKLNMTVLDQMRIIHCAHILIGVKGAGLQWMYFLKQPAAVIEIGWLFHKPNLYHKLASEFGMMSASIHVSMTSFNWDNLAKVNRNIDYKDPKERAKALREAKLTWWKKRSPYKVADGIVAPQDFKRQLQVVLKPLRNAGLLL